MRLGSVLKELIYPSKCVLCQRLLEKNELDLCTDCRLDAPEHPDLPVKLPSLDSWRAVWYYEGKVPDSIRRFKFWGFRHYARNYGRLLAMRLGADTEGFDLLTWVPTGRKRILKRGYDQAKLLAKAVGRELQVKPEKLLRKRWDNPPQSSLKGAAERRANVLGIYAVKDPGRIKGKRILLLDDVITTGATAAEAARMLLLADATEVHCGVVAAARHQDKTEKG